MTSTTTTIRDRERHDALFCKLCGMEPAVYVIDTPALGRISIGQDCLDRVVNTANDLQHRPLRRFVVGTAPAPTS